MLDEYTLVALALVLGRALTSAAVKGVFARIFACHGRPQATRKSAAFAGGSKTTGRAAAGMADSTTMTDTQRLYHSDLD